MVLLNADKIADVARRAGFSGEGLKVAIAIALAESGGDTRAQGKNGPTSGCPDGSLDRGLWQINNCYHPDVSDQCAYNPDCNAKAAYAISNQGTNFHPWSTFLNGAYVQHLSAAEQAINHGLQKVNNSPTAPKSSPSTSPVPSPVPRHYHVKVGDTLYGIAKRFYGSGDKWHDLYNANVQVIGDDPNTIAPNEVLIIP